jgi:hypothetical protein
MMGDEEMDERMLGRLIAAMPAPPQDWEQAAIELPALRRAADQVLALAETDAEFRAELVADLEAALRRAGHEPNPALRAAVRHRLADRP